jgi:hypothetical protein
MLLHTFNLSLKIITLHPGLDLRANPSETRELYRGDFTTFGMNMVHLSDLQQ